MVSIPITEDDPFKDWTLIHIPYCLEIFWGDATQTYREDLVVEHKGFVNVQSVFAWQEITTPHLMSSL